MITSSIIKRSTSTKPTLNPMHLLQRLVPPQAIIHIGAGTGAGEMHQWQQWNISHALIIDSDWKRLNWTERFIAKNPGWLVLGAVLDETESEIDYYQASNPEEDGLISPQCMNSLWPSLRTIAQDLRPSRRLDHLLAENCCAALKQADPTWVFVDCLSALPILKGAGAHIDRWSVLWLRVLLQPTAGIDESAVLENIEAFLQPQGFQCIDVTESNHPAVGYALFMRDWRAVLQPQIKMLTQANTILSEEKLALTARRNALEREITALTQARNEEGQLAAERQAKIETLTKERDSHASHAMERQAQIDALTQANTALKGNKEALVQEKLTLSVQRKALRQEVATLGQARDKQGKLAAERQAKIEALIKERDNYARQSAEHQTQIDVLTQANTALKGDKEALVQEKLTLSVQREALRQEMAILGQARDKQGKLAAERQAKIEALIKERDNYARQSAEHQTQIDVLTQANATLTEERLALTTRRDTLEQEITALTQARNEQGKLAAQHQTKLDQLQTQLKQKDTRIAQLESDLAELNARQHLLNDEMTRAEIQIDLIKDVLLREPGL